MDDSHVCGVGDDSLESEGDRLSELPDHLIHSILCLLPMKDIVGTTLLLSKRWYHLWATIPCLDFSFYDYTCNIGDFVNGAIALWKGIKILKFKFVSDSYSYNASDVDSWLRFAVDKQVEELHLEFYENIDYHPPPLLYSCSSLTKLILLGCSLHIGKNVEWIKLKSLTIHGIEPSSENSIDHILRNTPRLEEFYLLTIGHNLNIQSSSLKKLKINRHPNYKSNDEAKESMLRISAPNLESLEISGVPCRRCLLSVPSLTKAILGRRSENCSEDVLLLDMWRHYFQSLNHVEDITLSYWWIKVLCELKKNDTVVSFLNAKFVTLYPVATEETLGVVDIFPKLMMLVLEIKLNVRWKYLRPDIPGHAVDHVQLPISNLDSLEASLLHLRAVEIKWYLHDLSIFGVIEIILQNAKKLEKMVFQPASYLYDSERLCMVEEKLLSMPMASPSAQVFIKKFFGKWRTIRIR